MMEWIWKKKRRLLDEKELTLIRLLANEYSKQEMACEMNISLGEVEAGFKSIQLKTGAVSEVGIVLYALKHHLIPG